MVEERGHGPLGLNQPALTVATFVVRDGRLLLVEERVNGALVLNHPAGHLEPDESLVEAALRETREETGWDVALTGFVGAYQWKAETGRHYLRFAFAAEPVRHDPSRRRSEERRVGKECRSRWSRYH